MGRIFAWFGGTTVLLIIGYATVVATNPKFSHWSIILLLVVLIMVGLGTIVTGIIYLCQYMKLRNKTKREAAHNALKESFRKLRPDWTDEQAEIAATGSPTSYPLEGEEESCPKKKWHNHILSLGCLYVKKVLHVMGFPK